jgi:acetoin utilization protein AcuB
MKAIALAARKPVTVRPADGVRKAAQLMEARRIRHLPVVHNGRLVGMLSDRDVKLSLGDGPPRAGLLPPEVVEDAMSAPAAALSAGASASAAARRMLAERISAVPLLRAGRVVAVITDTDLMRAYARGRESYSPSPTVADVMTVDPAAIEPSTSVRTAAEMMRRRRCRHLLVADGDRLLGVLSDRDVGRAMGRETSSDSVERLWRGLGSSSAGEFMSSPVEAVEPDADLRRAAARMVQKKVGALAVMQQGRAVGIVTTTDVLEAFARPRRRSPARAGTVGRRNAD